MVTSIHRNTSGCREWWTQSSPSQASHPQHQKHLYERQLQDDSIYQRSPLSRHLSWHSATTRQEVQKLKTPQVQEQLLFNKHQFLQLTCFFNWPAPPHLILHCGKPLEHSWTGFLIAFCTNVMFFHMLFRFHCLNNLWRINVLGFCLCLWCCCKQYLHCICTSGYDKKFNMTWSLYPAWHLKAWM